MKLKLCFGDRLFNGLVVLIMFTGCVEQIQFDVPPAQQLMVVEGSITDSPGPYTLKVSTAFNLDVDTLERPPVQNAKIKLFDDQGNVEEFIEISPGVYQTNNGIQGQVGHAYYIRIETVEGDVFESEPDMMRPVGEVENIRYEYESRTKQETYGEVAADVFNIYLDSDAGEGDENFVRWRFTGMYKVSSNPELHMVISTTYLPYRDPRPCSGYILLPALGGGKLEKVGECTCCDCWVSQYEEMPQLSDAQLVADNQFNNIKIGEVPITVATFFDKYRVSVEQMSLSKNAFDFFKLIRDQKKNASSLFQPPAGEIRGNIHPVNSNEPVVGLFWASAIRTKAIYIEKSEVPYLLAPIYFVPDACDSYYANATTTKPAFWE